MFAFRRLVLIKRVYIKKQHLLTDAYKLQCLIRSSQVVNQIQIMKEGGANLVHSDQVIHRMYSVRLRARKSREYCVNTLENTLTHFLFYRLKILHECLRFEVLGKVTVCHVLFLGIVQTSPPSPWPPFFAPTALANLRSGSAESNQV